MADTALATSCSAAWKRGRLPKTRGRRSSSPPSTAPEALAGYLDSHTEPPKPEQSGRPTETRPRAPGRLPQVHHRRGLPRHRPEEDPRAAARPRPDARRRPQRLRQVQLRRGPRAAPHRRHLPLAQAASQGLARRLAQPPPQDRGHRGRVPGRGREGIDLRRHRLEGRRRPRRGRDLRPDPRQAAHGACRAGLGAGPQDLPALPLLQRAGLDARRGPVEALRRALGDPGPRRADGGAGGAGRGAQGPREGPQGRGAEAGRDPRPAAPDGRRPRAHAGGGAREEGLGPGRGREPSWPRPQPAPAARPTSQSCGSSPACRRRAPDSVADGRARAPRSARAPEAAGARSPRARRTWPTSSTTPCASTSSTATATARSAAARARSTRRGTRAGQGGEAPPRRRPRGDRRAPGGGGGAQASPRPAVARRARSSRRRAQVGLDAAAATEALDALARGPRWRRRARRPGRAPRNDGGSARSSRRGSPRKAGAELHAARTAGSRSRPPWPPGSSRPARPTKGAEAVKPLKAAEAWLKHAAADIRNERFAPDQGEGSAALEPAPPAEQRRARRHPAHGLRQQAPGRPRRHGRRRRRRRPRRDEPGRAERPGAEPLHPARHAPREPVPLRRHRRSRPVHGPLARGRPRARAPRDGGEAPGRRLHPRRPPARGRAPPGHPRHRHRGDAPRRLGGGPAAWPRTRSPAT